MSTFEREYKGHKITLTGGFKFRADGVGEFETMQRIEEAINKIEFKEYVAAPALLFQQYGSGAKMEEVVATRPHHQTQVWVKRGGKRATMSGVWADTPENRAVIAEIEGLREDAARKGRRISELFGALTPVVLVEKGGDK